MDRIAFYGKGGVGKTTIAASVTFSLARKGLKVLHVGCDPKHDSTISLVAENQFRTVMDQALTQPVKSLRIEHFLMRGRHNIDCIEAGGPEPGMGCGGRAVSRMFEILETLQLLDDHRYDAVVFDMLGDVVCGGFAAPLQMADPPKVVIVVSEELLAAYAANNISKAVLHYQDNGVFLAGLVLNLHKENADPKPIRRLARAMDTRILAEVPRSASIPEAELQATPITEFAPRSRAAGSIQKLADDLLEIERAGCNPPRPLDMAGVRNMLRGMS